MNNKPIVLSDYGAVKFIAEMSFVDNKIDTEYVSIFEKSKPVKRDGKMYFEENPDYPYKTREEERVARHKHEQKRREYIIEYLKENFPNEDYAERYERENIWDKPRRTHNEETESCQFITEDGSHCKIKREETTCYTCCFNCSFPIGFCEKGECIFI